MTFRETATAAALVVLISATSAVTCPTSVGAQGTGDRSVDKSKGESGKGDKGKGEKGKDAATKGDKSGKPDLPSGSTAKPSTKPAPGGGGGVRGANDPPAEKTKVR